MSVTTSRDGVQLDRTVVATDNQGGFEGPCKLVNGNHIEVDGDTVFNPFHIEETPPALRDKLDMNPYTLSARSARNIIAGTIQNEGSDISEYIHTLEELIHLTFKDAEIYRDDYDSHGNQSPDVTDMVRIAEDVLDHPNEYTVTSNEIEEAELEEEMAKIVRRLNGFTPTGKHRNLVGQMEVTLEPGTFNYLDTRKVDDDDPSERSVKLSQMLVMTAEMFKIAQGECLAIFDEAHNFLENLRMVQWLATMSRQLRNYNGALWLVSQSLFDFASLDGDTSEIAQYKDVIREQCSTIDQFQQNTVDEEIAREKFNMGPKHQQFITDDSIAGEAGVGYSTAITSFSDRSGWYEYEINRGPISKAVNTYKRSVHGDFDEFMDTALLAVESYEPGGHETLNEYVDRYMAEHGYEGDK